ncbi:RagB/SusD family nutrient uptake outer membrane protein [Chitinophaga nivalis]|uniref:RagB/SusD family nutrient uptake outer membrane protein n=1 Tax=Chitinophaga nivalis TaxID=2991709 RepID=A0ABT3IT71_9BACT|nr:RagB/SusD family nutrient uptake outer membrane protein [Chitinophaga nivalis]MCW3463416.1 RagB/SusD family nutrient uptake outer membrane protein [Chitinophaga nivalis]MCW3486894.1 RagB/SusD family nutrient uptake outer membrane protein [Chitinophaga nivalis]
MNKKILTAIYACSLLALSACKKDFLNTVPADKVSEENFWRTEKDANLGVTAIYNALQNNDIYGLNVYYDGLTPIAWIWDDGGTGLGPISKGNMDPFGNAPANKFKVLYNAVFRANLAIAKLPGVNMDDAAKKRLIGEATFLRALFYYHLVDFYGDVPLITKVLQLGDALPGKETKAKLLDFIIAEANTAAEALPAAKNTTGKATKGAALTLKAKALLMAKRYPEVVTTCQTIGTLGYELYKDYRNMFISTAAENNTEVIFDIQYIGPGLGQGSLLDKRLSTRSSFSSGWSNVYPSVTLVNSYEMKNGKAITETGSGYDSANPYKDRDPRLDYTIVRPGATWREIKYEDMRVDNKSKFTGYMTRKYVLEVDGYGAGDSPLNYIIFRYADVLLMLAEAENEAAGADGITYDAINKVRAREGVNMPAIPAGKTRDQMRDIIRHERMIEFAMEGSYYSDLRRWDIATNTMNGLVVTNIAGQQLDKITFIKAFNLWPIPQKEIDLNSNLVQNPDYVR